MWTILLIAFVFTEGEVESFSEECQTKLNDCHDLYPEKRMTVAPEFLTEEELETFCPDLVKMADCFEDYIEECLRFLGGPFYDQEDGPFYKEICEANGALRSKYLTYVDCYKKIENANVRMSCYMDGLYAYDHYVQSKVTSDTDSKFPMSRLSLVLPYALGCEAAEIEKTCGSEASETFIKLEKLKDHGGFIKYNLNNLQIKNELYNEFLPSLQISENQRRHINTVLDVFKE